LAAAPGFGTGRAAVTAGQEAVAGFEALLSDDGARLLASLPPRPLTPAEALRLGAGLRAAYPAGLVAAALAQHELRLKAREKFPRAMEMFFTRPGLEQASAAIVASHRAYRYVHSGRVADLCCGIGGDLLALAAAHPVLAVDADPLALRVARANAAACGVARAVTFCHEDARRVSLAGVDAVFIDPARRSGQRRLPARASDPPLDWCFGLAQRVGNVGIKAAPGVPRHAVPPGWELEFVSVGRDLKEAAAWSPALATAPARATVLPGAHSRARQPLPASSPPGPDTTRVSSLIPVAGDPVGLGPPAEFLLDPNPAVTRAGLVEDLARLTGAWKIDSQIAFLATATPVDTPFARTLRVIGSAPWNQRRLPAMLRALDIGAVDIRRRGLAGDVDGLRRRLRLSGSRRATLVMTRVQGRPWALVCVDTPPPVP
jgi:SAM-dependent methyltransferase